MDKREDLDYLYELVNRIGLTIYEDDDKEIKTEKLLDISKPNRKHVKLSLQKKLEYF